MANTVDFGAGIKLDANAGIQFPATQVADADVNTLDDYEEGTFTPGLTFGGAATGMTISSRSAAYTKIGNVVRFTINVNLSAKGSSTGVARLTGLPFAAAGSPFSVAQLRFGALGTPPTTPQGNSALVDVSATTIQLVYLSSAGVETNYTDAHFGNTTSVIVTGTYNV